jgi:hypothetical protein
VANEVGIVSLTTSSSPTAPKTRLPALFDTGALITSAKFSARGLLLIDHLLTCCRIRILPEVRYEAVDAGLLSGYADAIELEQRVASGTIRVTPAPAPAGELEAVLAGLGLQDTDRLLIHAQRQGSKSGRLVTDDHRLWVTATRLNMPVAFLPDLLLALVKSERLPRNLVQEMLNALRPRYASAFVELALKRLEGVI